MDTTTPIIKGLEAYESILGGEVNGQPEYAGLSILRSTDGRLISRWTFTDEERASIAGGADLFLTTMTFNNPFQPVMLEVGAPMGGESAEMIKRNMRLDDQAELMELVRDANAKHLEAHQARLRLEEKKQQVFTPEVKPDLLLVH